MTPSVVVVTDESDVHAKATCSILQSEFGVKATIVDTARFPSAAGEFRQSHQECTHQVGGVPLDEVRAVWWRRPAPCTVPTGLDPSHDEFRQIECDGFIQGLLWSLDSFWVNDPGAQRTASRKIVQLSAAKAAGLAVPETLITNNPATAAQFIADRQEPTIYKRTGTGPGPFTETRMMTTEDLPRLSQITLAPTTFQEYIDAECDLRVVWIAGQSWTVRIDSQSGAGWLDSRLDNSVAFAPFDLPVSVSASLDSLMAALGLVFGVIDLRMSVRDREIYFLEVNPQGQFAYLEIKSGLPIMRGLAALLAERSH